MGKELPQATSLLTNHVQEMAVERTLAQQKAEDMARLVAMASAALPLNATVTAKLVPVPGKFIESFAGLSPSSYNYSFEPGSQLRFDVSLTSGNGSITNAALHGWGTATNGSIFDFSLAGGSGRVQNGQFTIGGFQHTSAFWGGWGGAGYAYTVTDNDVRGKLSHNNTSVTGVNGEFRVRADDLSTPGASAHSWYQVNGEFAK